jgi:hypothetical protein
MTQSPNLALPYLAAAQAQKHVTVNEALRLLDAVVMLAVLDRDLAAPPASPADGARYIVGAGATGAWAGHVGTIAAWQDGAWAFIAPRPGFLAYVVDEAALVVWDGTSWQTAGGGAPSVLDNLTRLGVGTAADATNPFAAKLNNALWTAKTAAEGGDGALRYKMNKESAAATLSLLMQTGYSGRAEIGLTGDDDLHVKVSPDGAAWIEAIRIDKASGRVAFPATGGPREVLTAARTYYVRPDGSDTYDGRADSAARAFLTIQKAIDTVAQLDIAGNVVTIQLGDGTYGPIALKNVAGFAAPGNLVIKGNSGTPANVLISGAGAAIAANSITSVWDIKDLKVQATIAGSCVDARGGAKIRLYNIVYGAAVSSQLYSQGAGSLLTMMSSYGIVGPAAAHYNALNGGTIAVGATITITSTGLLNYSAAFAFATLAGQISANAMTFTGGTITGQRYNASSNSVIFTNAGGASYFPGDVSGATATGGQYT